MIVLGAAVAVRRGAHFRLHLLIDRFRPGARRRVDLAVILIAIAFAGVLPGERGKVCSPDRHSSSISDCPQPWKCPPHLYFRPGIRVALLGFREEQA
jgi:hypothetical protein